MSPMMKKVEKAGVKAIAEKRKPYKITSDDFFKNGESLKSQFGSLLNLENGDDIAVIPSVSYGLANVVNNLPKKKGKIIITEGQFPSNVYPWMSLEKNGYKVEIVKAPRKATKGKAWNEKIIEAIDKETVALAIGHVHWTDGTRFELGEFRKRLNDVNGLLIIDGTQSIGALPFDQKEIQADAIVCAGYKWLMGPYGIGLAYFGEKFANGSPIEENWINRLNSEDFTELINYQEKYREGAQRYSVGEQSNFILVSMLLEALKHVNKWSPEKVQDYSKELMAGVISDAMEMGFKIDDEGNRGHHLFGIQMPKGIDSEKASTVFKKRKVSISIRGNSIRVAPHVYNDEVDVAKFHGALEELAGS